MSIFRIVYRQNDYDQVTSERVEATEFLERKPWIVFLDPSGTCLTLRSESVERIERLQPALPAAEPRPSPPSDLTLPATWG